LKISKEYLGAES